ncbi:tetratricopeptide repeat-containing sensor histidine kinase [Flavobacterium selenitireducens]|uniref:tetratricopeptide repeat-containing sensor histidine kinase n=1 Tax=Flavobacterium selenitireducens TaxID=2722704 RepID=UPI00168ADC06|nr:tetratricopeptide repeat protein [Flavobacterium selenitireducens]MBD3583371.1 tetratricopeptide repeat protein [Flavobacterium selenitireducens]
MKNLGIIGLVLLIFGCQQKTASKATGFTANQKAVIAEFRRMKDVSKLPVDSMSVFAGKLESMTKSEQNEFKAMALIARGSEQMNRAQYELGYKSFENAMRLLKNSDTDTLKGRVRTGFGNYYKQTGDYPKALNNLLEALRIFETHGDLRGMSMTNGNIGQVYMQKNDIALAKEHLRKAMDVYANQKWQPTYLNAAHTLANVHGISGEYPEALRIDEEGIRISDSIKSPKLKVPFLDNKAMCHLFGGRLDSAEFYFNETLKIDLVIGDDKQIADTYSNLASLESKKGNFAKAERYALKSISMLETINNQVNLIKSVEILGELYQGWGKYPQALAAKNRYLDLYKTLMNEKREAAMAEFKIVHETEKKEKIIAQNHLQLLKKEKEVHRRNNLIGVISLAALFIGLVGFFIYRQQRLRNRQMEQEHELKTAIAQIETQNKLQEQRLEISRDLHDNIGAQLTFIISSVDNLRYAFDLKDSRLEQKLNSINNFTKSTIVELRDTIWAMDMAEIALEDLRIRIFNFIEKARGAKEDIEFEFNIDERLDNLRLTSVGGMNLYRSVQEGVNNAMKYSNATKIAIYIACKQDDLQLRIEDNGVGFDTALTSKGSGLVNMKKRIAALGGFLSLESSGSGTRITIEIPGFCKK